MTTNYSIDYLNTLTVPELHNLAKNYLDFNTSQMERELKVPRETTRNIKDGTSLKHTNVVKNYLVDFLLKDNHLKYDPNEKFNLNIITTNYEPLLLKIFPDFFIGFDKTTKEFCQQEIILDNHKNCLYHIHGSLYNRLEKNEIIYDEEDYLNNNVTI